MLKHIFILASISTSVFGQNVFTNTADKAKIELAKQKMYAGQYLRAVNSLEEISKTSPNDANLFYYMGNCNYMLSKYDKAKENLNKSIGLNPNKAASHFVLGKILQGEEKFDEAITEFNLCTTNSKSGDADNQDATVFIEQCNTAKKLIASPVDVEIINAGDINSKYDDKNPCITADGSLLVFTTRRPENVGSALDAEGDGKYFEDIYIASFDTSVHKYANAKSVPGSVNTNGHDACTSISPDGKQIFLYKNDLNDKMSRGGDVFVSKINNGKWKTPEQFGKPVASSYWEGGACVSPDGKRLFFFSERKGGLGGSDIWMVEKINKKEWGKPVNLGAPINSIYDEGGMFLAPDGKTLFFCSNGPTSIGSYDIFKTVLENGKWSAPMNLGYPINSSGKEGQLSISANGKTAYFSSERAGGMGESDIYMINLKDYAILEKDNKLKINDGLSILKGTVRDGYEGYGVAEVEIIISDASGTHVASTNTNENGEYFLTLKGGQGYKIDVKKKGFQEISETFELKLGAKETVTLEKGYLLKK
ncbi:MAG: carboxypeptidase regulatory-like domain-containing protein [Bacteroidota bacterium]|nr:carboxypeptidase regulatory-like domain-containing protein [Bacteroidota bacterium]